MRQFSDRTDATINPTYDGLAPEAAPVLQSPHAATVLVTHHAFGTDGQVAFQPLVGHEHLGKMKTNTEIKTSAVLSRHIV